MGIPGNSTSNNMSVMDEEPQHDQSKINIKLLTAQQRKEALGLYRKVFDNVKSIDANDEDFGEMLDKLRDNVNDQNQCLQQVGVNELMTMDARCMSMSSELSYNLVKKFHTESKFDTHEFIRRLRQRVIKNSSKSGMRFKSVEQNEGRWVRFEQLAATGFAYSGSHHQVPVIVRAFRAPLEKPPASGEAKERRKTQRTQPTQKTQPTQYDSTNMANNLDESEKRLMHIHKQLGKLEKLNNEAVPLMQAAMDPKNYALTIENFFNIAFLARQAKISLELPEDETEPMVRTFQDKTEKKQNNQNVPGTSNQMEVDEEQETGDPSRRNIQSIMSFDFETYQNLVKNLEISRSAIDRK